MAYASQKSLEIFGRVFLAVLPVLLPCSLVSIALLHSIVLDCTLLYRARLYSIVLFSQTFTSVSIKQLDYELEISVA